MVKRVRYFASTPSACACVCVFINWSAPLVLPAPSAHLEAAMSGAGSNRNVQDQEWWVLWVQRSRSKGDKE